ncbi:hypothetical protein EDB84DRAFT_1636638 [Lactarius hengduanensis]|nr:hypothetical protein EDB84DRAFT_1636638 [Lactarius hengduanensis]
MAATPLNPTDPATTTTSTPPPRRRHHRHPPIHLDPASTPPYRRRFDTATSTTHQPATTLIRSRAVAGTFRVTVPTTWMKARRTRHSSVYESAVSLMRDALLFAPTLQLQHATPAQAVDVTHMVPLDFASYQVDLHQLEGAIETYVPTQPEATIAINLIFSGTDRYELSNKEPDASNLDNLKAILHLTESMLLQPQSSPEPKHIIQFFPLSPSHSNDALGIIPNTPLTQPNTSAIFETSLTAQHPGSCAINLTTSLVNVTVFSLVPDQPLDQVIECLRLAKIHKPKLRRAHFALALYLRARHYMTLVNDDYEEFASTLDEIITSSPPGDSQDEGIVTQAQELVTAVAMFRSSAHKSPEYMEAIYRAHAFRSSFTQAFPAEHLLRFKINKRLENSTKLRFSNFGPTDLEAHEASSSHSPLSQPEPVAFYQPEFVRMYKKAGVDGAVVPAPPPPPCSGELGSDLWVRFSLRQYS